MLAIKKMSTDGGSAAETEKWMTGKWNSPADSCELRILHGDGGDDYGKR